MIDLVDFCHLCEIQ